MARTLRFVGPVMMVLLVSSSALAEVGGGGDRPRGFSIEVGLAASSAFYTEGLLDGFAGVAFAPELALGAQLGRLSFALTTSISMIGSTFEAAGEEYASSFWTVRLGPYVDGEIWSSGRVALFLYGGLDALVYSFNTDFPDDDDDTTAGFGFDVGLGGRIYVVPQFPIAVKFGTAFDVVFMDEGGFDTQSMAWSIYGALAFRFVASR